MTELITHTNSKFEGIFKGVWVNVGNVPTDIPPFTERKEDILSLLNNLPIDKINNIFKTKFYL